ncbi:MAG: hypothetical protein HQL56_01025 [Magnetococcales bacterium]|nr:hypothetical protein [Magnetococcales bacterium]
MKVMLHASNFLRLSSATLTIQNGFTLVAGPNGAGKSSLFRAISACGTGQVIPVMDGEGKELVPRGKSAIMVHDGQKKATVTMTGPDTAITISWPANSVSGKPPISLTPMSASQVEWMSMPQATRMKLLSAALAKGGISTEPTREDLVSELGAVGLTDTKYVEFLWVSIQEKGWEGTLAKISSMWSEATGAWRAVTKEAYGAEKAKTWTPKGWREELRNETAERLQEALTSASENYKDGIARQAVDGENLEKLRLKAKEPTLETRPTQEKISRLKLEIQALDEEIAALAVKDDQEGAKDLIAQLKLKTEAISEKQREIETLEGEGWSEPEITADATERSNANGKCPACGVELFVDFGVVELATVRTEDEINAEIAEARKKLEETEKHNCGISSAIETLNQEIEKLEVEKADLEKQIEAVVKQARETRQKEIKTKQQKLSAKRDELQTESSNITLALFGNQEISRAKKEVEVAEEKASTAVSAEEVLRLAGLEGKARNDCLAFQAWTEATGYAGRAARLALAKEVLTQEGLRAKKLRSVLQQVNGLLASLSVAAEWGPVTLLPGMDLAFGGHPFFLLSESAKYRCQATMQAALAILDGSQLLMFDGADILDSKGRMGLLGMLAKLPETTAFIIAMTAKRDYAETVSRYFDACYWVQDGTVASIKTAKEQ